MAWRLVANGKAGALVLVVGFTALMTSHFAAYQQGRSTERQLAADAVSEYRERVVDAQRRLQESQRARQDEQREALREIRDVEDPAGCADGRVPSGILDRL